MQREFTKYYLNTLQVFKVQSAHTKSEHERYNSKYNFFSTLNYQLKSIAVVCVSCQEWNHIPQWTLHIAHWFDVMWFSKWWRANIHFMNVDWHGLASMPFIFSYSYLLSTFIVCFIFPQRSTQNPHKSCVYAFSMRYEI